MRRLIYVPIVHTAADMGSQAEALEREHVRRHGRGEWARTRRLIDEVWEGLRTRLLALNLDYRRVRIYQDGLPVCGRELDIVREVAQGGSRNYALILELLSRGAVVEGTESPGLLREEYERIRSAIPAGQAREEDAGEGERLLRQRDEFIGRRIDETLKEGEVGILFIGLMHRVDRFLAPDIEVQYLIHRLPFQIPPGDPGPRTRHGG
ncbi:MAG: hypothetical protein HYT85_09495 [candidate division NC10 bacterium]|nr:hypothetical protein [candidate division NC10 bacterium]MBI3122624.1 hypothetical protein [candidate division NC10 bacterium]